MLKRLIEGKHPLVRGQFEGIFSCECSAMGGPAEVHAPMASAPSGVESWPFCQNEEDDQAVPTTGRHQKLNTHYFNLMLIMC